MIMNKLLLLGYLGALETNFRTAGRKMGDEGRNLVLLYEAERDRRESLLEGTIPPGRDGPSSVDSVRITDILTWLILSPELDKQFYY